MTDLLKEILDVDRAARERVATAQNERNEAYLSVSVQKETLIRDEKEKARRAAEEQSLENRKTAESALQALREKNGRIMRQMDALYGENRERWVADVVASALSEV
ncbi:MAG: hypothetical protein IJL26_03510 [Clostridia bacterium]|nr:hypothetical protein [Clostridia bacterium]